MHSMTGYGRGMAEREGTRVAVQIAAVNSKKQAEIRFSIPRELGGLEPFVRKQLKERVERGSLNVGLSYELGPEWRGRSVVLDLEVASHVLAELREFARREHLAIDIRVGELVAVPGVVQHQNELPDDLLRELAQEAITKAVDELDVMREAEGAALAADLKGRCAKLQGLAAEVAARADLAQTQHHDRLRERIAKLGLELATDDERLAREVAFHVDRSDVTEELVRLRSHFEQFTVLLEQAGAVGRKLDFIAQEMSREIGTLGAKTIDSEISTQVIDFKVELGRIREQVLNVE
ncbi:MAG: YicC family protein [Victivallales bacterium]|nr:YicC family protein [Victivallales bacterium]